MTGEAIQYRERRAGGMTGTAGPADAPLESGAMTEGASILHIPRISMAEPEGKSLCRLRMSSVYFMAARSLTSGQEPSDRHIKSWISSCPPLPSMAPLTENEILSGRRAMQGWGRKRNSMR